MIFLILIIALIAIIGFYLWITYDDQVFHLSKKPSREEIEALLKWAKKK